MRLGMDQPLVGCCHEQILAGASLRLIQPVACGCDAGRSEFQTPMALESPLGKPNRLAYQTLANAGGNRIAERLVIDAAVLARAVKRK